MVIEADAYSLLTIFGIGHGLLIGLLLILLKARRGKAALYLGISQITGAMILLYSLSADTNILVLYPRLLLLIYPSLFFSPFFLLLYVRSLLFTKPGLTGYGLLWLSGPVVGLAFTLPYLLSSKGQLLSYTLLVRNTHTLSPYDWLIWLIGLLYSWAVIVASLIMIRGYRKRLRQLLSATEKVDLHLLVFQLVVILVLWVSVTIISLLSYQNLLVDLSIKLSGLLPVLFQLLLAYSFLLRLFDSAPVEPKEENPLRETLSKSESEEDFRAICQEMEERKHFLDPELSLPELAERTSFFRNELSELINLHTDKGFYHFVNGYRIEYAKELLESDNSSTILELAYASGFGSKSAFYNAFGQLTGMSPSAYRKEYGR